MGVKIFRPSKSRAEFPPFSTHTSINFNPNPNPANYFIQRHEQIGQFLVVQIKYPDCTNFEGLKILVFSGIKYKDLCKQALIDPHFSDKNLFNHHPIARFVPTDYGWRMALDLCSLYWKSF